MLADMDVMNCQSLAVPNDVMHHVVSIESSFNPYAIGVVGAHLVRQPQSLDEAVATARMLETRGYNFSVGLAQVNRYNLPRYGLRTYRDAFDGCTNLRVGASILSHCLERSGQDWGRAFSCYYSGNFVTGFRAGYVQKVFALWRHSNAGAPAGDRNADIAADHSSNRHLSRIEVSAPVTAKTAADDIRTSIDQPDSVVVLSRPPGSLSQTGAPQTPVSDTAFVF